MPNVITPQQFAAQWLHAPHDLSLNAFNFEIEAAKIATKVFKESFTQERFNSRGSHKWPARHPLNSGTHPLLMETGSLYSSITWKHEQGKGATVYTDPKAFSGTKRHKGFCFAAVHNEGLPIKAWGRINTRMPKRQFIGDSTVLEQKLNALIPMLFKGLPH